MFKNILLTILLSLLTLTQLKAQKDSTFIKEGYSFGVLPAVSFDADLGFQYGALVNIFDYGDGVRYPNYDHSLYFEASQYTAGSTLLRAYYDSPKLIKGIKTTADVTYFKDLALNFYGFNGSQAIYNASWEDTDAADYKSRVFYRHQREMFRVITNFKGHIGTKDTPFEWLGGFAFFNMKAASVDVENLNKNKSEDNKLIATDGLYDKYVGWGIIKEHEKNGGINTYLKGGLSYDTRNRLGNPSRGMWTELMLAFNPTFLSSTQSTYSRLTFVHRQYLPLSSRDNLVLAYRLGWQHKLSGDIPFYLLSHLTSSSLTSASSEGLGGAKTLRGILRNRVVSDGAVLTNVELRWKFWRTKLFKNDFYLASNYFVDMGLVTQKHKVDVSKVDDSERSLYFNQGNDKLHMSYGLGIKAAMNENFIISTDYGMALNKQDGTSGLYITLNYLF